MAPIRRQQELELFKEPTTTPGIIPLHLKRATATENPIIEVVQRILSHLKPGTGASVEKLLALIALFKVLSPAWHHVQELFLWAFTSRINVNELDPVANDIILWIATEVVDKRLTMDATVTSGTTGAIPPEFLNYHIIQGHAKRQSEDFQLHCLPPIGKKIFWIGYRPFLFTRNGVASGNSNARLTGRSLIRYQTAPANSITLHTPGWSLSPLKNFIKTCHEYRIINTAGTTNVYSTNQKTDYQGQTWYPIVKSKRKLDTIDMEDQLKLELVKDAEYYYSEESKKFYADCGIPYRRGYLFYGPPGTGKTSFSAALAGHLGCDLYLINLAAGDVSDGSLNRLFQSLPRKCIVVIEDIDSCGIGREQGPASTAPKFSSVPQTSCPGVSVYDNGQIIPATSTRSKIATPQKRNMVTLSGLLNAIDGNASGEGRLLIMTSNNPDTLDEALTRPGRVDKKVHFGKMKQKAISDIFKRLVGRSAIATKGYTEEQIEEYAAIFSDKVPQDTFTPAQLQNFLQNCRGDPFMAMDGISSWIEEETRDQVLEEALNVSPQASQRSLDEAREAALARCSTPEDEA